jgi:hypothetical protein
MDQFNISSKLNDNIDKLPVELDNLNEIVVPSIGFIVRDNRVVLDTYEAYQLAVLLFENDIEIS